MYMADTIAPILCPPPPTHRGPVPPAAPFARASAPFAPAWRCFATPNPYFTTGIHPSHTVSDYWQLASTTRKHCLQGGDSVYLRLIVSTYYRPPSLVTRRSTRVNGVAYIGKTLYSCTMGAFGNGVEWGDYIYHTHTHTEIDMNI